MGKLGFSADSNTGARNSSRVLNRKSQFLKAEYFSRKADSGHVSAAGHGDSSTAGFGLIAQEAGTRAVGQTRMCPPRRKHLKKLLVLMLCYLVVLLSVLMG